MTELTIIKSGMLTSVQDLGRWGHQASGVPVAGAMDLPALRIGNAMVGNDEGAAALEVTLMGPRISVKGGGLAVFAGSDLGFSVNGRIIGSWVDALLHDGDVISFTGPRGGGCRGCLCLSGGIDVPVVMGSRSTYSRARMGGFNGRALKDGDVLNTGEPAPLMNRMDGFSLPDDMRPVYDPEKPLYVCVGLQSDAFTEEGLKTLFGSEYMVSAQSDRMGSRMEGPKIEHKNGADIVSDAIPLGALQVPGHGMPIVMLADRQTTGGYTKAGVLSPLSIEALAQRMPGSKVRFERCTVEDAEAELKSVSDRVERVRQMRFSRISRAHGIAAPALSEGEKFSAELKLTVNGKSYDVKCEEL